MRVRHDFIKLDRFVRAISSKYVVRVGIFTNKNTRKEEGVTNADVGLAHELGSPTRHIPIRSWLVMPLRVSQKEIVRKASIGLLDLLAADKMERVMRDFGFACEDSILDAFKSGGFGTWKPLKPSTIKRKGSSAILIDTGQLRRAVASQVVKA